MNQQQSEQAELGRSFSQALLPFVSSRLLILAILVLVTHTTVSFSGSGEDKIMHPQTRVHSFAESMGVLHGVYMIADADWYRKIAERGYAKRAFSKDRQENWAFFPLFPLAAKALSQLTGNYLIAGLLISNICFLLTLTLLHRLAQLYGYGEAAGQRAQWFVSFFPTSYFLTAPITEALFFFLSVLAFYLLKRRCYIWVGIVFAFLTASRPTGLLLMPALFVAFFESGRRISFRGFLALCLAPLGAVLFSWHLYTVTGNALAWADIQGAWERAAIASGELPTLTALDPSLLMTDWSFRLLHLLCLLLALWAMVILLRRKAFALATFVAVPILVALCTGSILSLSRYVLVLYPVFLILGDLASTPSRERTILAVFAFLLAVMTAMFGLGVTAAMA